jgi:hypothetical protein
MRYAFLASFCLFSACSTVAEAPAAPPDAADAFAVADTAAAVDLAETADAAPDAAAQGLDIPADSAPDAGSPADAPTEACPAGQVCVTSFPFGHDADTATAKSAQLNNYACKPGADESGAEVIYRVTVPAAGFLSAAVHDGANVDVDVHILSALDAAKCLDRGDLHARADVTAGTYFVVIDTFVSQGKPQAGPYHVDIGWLAPTQGACELQVGEMARVNDGGKPLKMPAQGPVVMEAHLVTQQEPAPYPQTFTEELAAHYQLSQNATGLVMFREQVWAPKEGGTFYGAGIGSPTQFPLLDEGWYVNMYWTAKSRPKAGTRMILRKPGTDRAVVVSAGYETGPGNLAHVAGTPEETHFYLGTGHLSVLDVGIAVDQKLALGPRRCQ